MRHIPRLLAVGVVAGAVVAPSLTAAVANDDPFSLVCVPPLVASPARCTLDIYGTVTDLSGAPMPGVLVNDGGKTAITDSNGFYDLHEIQFGTYSLSFSRSDCSGPTSSVTVTPMALVTGGVRHDKQLPCSP